MVGCPHLLFGAFSIQARKGGDGDYTFCNRRIKILATHIFEGRINLVRTYYYYDLLFTKTTLYLTNTGKHCSLLELQKYKTFSLNRTKLPYKSTFTRLNIQWHIVKMIKNWAAFWNTKKHVRYFLLNKNLNSFI